MPERRRQETAPIPRRSGLVASAAVMAQHPKGLRAITPSEQWQEDAWRYYDEVGELRFGVGWLANGMSRVNLIAARQPESLGDEPRAIIPPDPDDPEGIPLTATETLAHSLVQAIAGGAISQGQMLSSLSTLLTVPGVSWLLMESVEPEQEYDPSTPLRSQPAAVEEPPVPTETWAWMVLSSDELRAGQASDPLTGEAMYEICVGEDEWRMVRNDHVLVRIWKRHPRKSWVADSPCRAVLNVLRQIHLLDECVNAAATSRLAGAGLLILPQDLEISPIVMADSPVRVPDIDLTMVEDKFVDILIETMSLPTSDRGTAAAIVPLVIRIPGEFVDKVRHITFWSEFSNMILPLRESAIKRLALGLDMPPEILLGLGDVNHWGQWAIEETAITLHIEPMAETIVSGITAGYLRPALLAAGVAPEEVADFIVWYDTTDLTTRPDRSTDATAAYDRIELSGQALRREIGLSEDDAPDEDEKRERRLWELAKALGGDFAQELTGIAPPAPAANPFQPAPSDEETPEEDTGAPAVPEDQDQVAASAILEACDGLVHRALERAGARLRSAAGRRHPGGASAVGATDLTRLHCQIDASSYDLSALMVNAWTRVPEVAERLGMNAAALTSTLDTYTRALIATGHEHDTDRLAHALGLVVAS